MIKMINIILSDADVKRINLKINCKVYIKKLKNIYDLFCSESAINYLNNIIDDNLDPINEDFKITDTLGSLVMDIPNIVKKDDELFINDEQIHYKKNGDEYIVFLNNFVVFPEKENFAFGYKKIFFRNPYMIIDCLTYENFVNVIKKVFSEKSKHLIVRSVKNDVHFKNYYLFSNSQKIRKYEKEIQKKFFYGKTHPYIYSLIISGYYVNEKRFKKNNLYVEYNFEGSFKINDIMINFG
jgi:hypothetical protein